MWFELLMPIAIIGGAIAGPGYILYACHKWVVGNHFRRSMIDRWDRHAYQRDLRLTGNPYDVHGLESIPDEK